MRILLTIAVVSYIVVTDLILFTIAGAPSPPIWEYPEIKSFNLEYTDSSGCDEVSLLKALPTNGASVSISVVSQGTGAVFDAVQINDTSAKLTCDLTRIVNGGPGIVYSLSVRDTNNVGNEFADISLVITAVESSSNGQPVFKVPDPDPLSEKHKIYLEETAKGGEVVLWLSASDPDTATAFLVYNMEKSEETTSALFEVNGNTIKVKSDVVEGTFDYDKNGALLQYPIVLEVSDGALSSSVETDIFVVDVNDNVPVFEAINDVEVYESNVEGYLVVQVVATDADGTEENNQVTFSMTGSTDFSINETTGNIVIAPGVTLDFNVRSAYSLTITATDNAPGGALSSSITITVTVVTGPQFINLATATTVSVFENATTDTPIFELTVIDKDQPEDPTLSIERQLPEAVFRLDRNVLKLKSGVTLNAGLQDVYTLIFKAEDGNSQWLSATLTVNVEASKTATVNPAVQKYLSENTPAGTVVTTVTAGDLNNENDIRFSMKGDSSSDFVINQVSGVITVVQLDYTDKQIYTLIVTATDGDSIVETPVIIFIKTSPVFVDPSSSLPATTSISVREDTPARVNFKRLTASDEDGDTLTYSIVTQIPPSDQAVFAIRGANLGTAKSLSEHTLDVDAADTVPTYLLQLRVSDGRSVSVDDTVNVTITITDSNEPPIFPPELNLIQNITETTESGSSVFTVKATDGDRTPENRKIKYSLSGTTDFDIHKDTGEITVATETDLSQTANSLYSFTVTATDGGTPSMSSSVNVTINILKIQCNMLIDQYGNWPVTTVEHLATIECENLYEGNYSRMCSANGVWGTVSNQCEIQETVLNEIREQLSVISNSSEVVTSDIEYILEMLTRVTGTEVDGEVIENVTVILKDIVAIVETTKNVTDNSTQYFFETVSNFMKPENQEALTKAGVQGSDILDVVDKYMALLQEVMCNRLDSGEVKQVENYHLYTEVGRKSGNVVFPSIKQTEAVIDIPERTLQNSGITNICFGGAYYNTLGDIMEQQVTNEVTVESFPEGEVNSDIIAIQLHSVPAMSFDDLDPPVRINLTLKNATYYNPVCVFWDYNITNESGRKGAWSAEGCVLEEITNLTATCACSHLTNFAILMSPSKISAKHSMILGIISAVGCSVSMVCLVLTIIAHRMVWKAVRNNRTVTLMHLCVALLLAFGVFLAGVNRTESRVACVIIAALIQFLFLTVFFLMLFIGIEILLSVVQVFGNRFRLSRFLPVAWLVPAVIVGISLGVTKTEGYGNDRFCWLDIDSGLIWSFIGPAVFVIFVNVIIIAIVFKKMASATFVKSKTSTVKIKTWLKSLCVLLPMMGVTWLFGVLSVNSDMFILQYMFSIFNSLQGLFIFLFHCVFNRQLGILYLLTCATFYEHRFSNDEDIYKNHVFWTANYLYDLVEIRQALKHRKERRRTLATIHSELRNTAKDEHSRSMDQDKKQSIKSET